MGGLWAGEVESVVAAVGAAFGIGVADADLGDLGAEDVVAVDRAVHPPVEGAIGGAAEGRVADVDILGGVGIGIVLSLDAGIPGGAVTAVMVHVSPGRPYRHCGCRPPRRVCRPALRTVKSLRGAGLR